MLAELTALPSLSFSLFDAFTKYIDGRATEVEHFDKLMSTIRTIMPYVQTAAITDVVSVGESIIEAGKKRGLANATINKQLGVLRRVANLAFKWGWIDVQLGAKIDKLPASLGRENFLSLAEVDQLALAEPVISDTVLFLTFTGMRCGEAFKLVAADRIDATHILIPKEITKTKSPRLLPIPARIQHVAIPLTLSRNVLSNKFILAREAIGRPEVTLHDLRHTYASWMANAGVEFQTLQKLLGHKSPSMTNRYSHLMDSTFEAAVAKMETFHKAGTKAGTDEDGSA